MDSFEPEECPNCGQRTIRGTVCQSCGMDLTPPPAETKLSKYTPSTSCKHPYWNARDVHHSAISELMYARYGVSWPEWRDTLHRVARLIDVQVEQEHVTTVDDTDAVEAQVLIALDVETSDAAYCKVQSIFAAIAALPEPKRTAVSMWANSMSHREIAEACGWDEDYSRLAIKRILAGLRDNI